MASDMFFNPAGQALKIRYRQRFEREDFETFLRCLRKETIPSLSHVIHDMTEVREVRVPPADLVDWALERSAFLSDQGGPEVRVAFVNVPEPLQTHVEVWRAFFENRYTPLKYETFSDLHAAERWVIGAPASGFVPLEC